MYQARTPDNGQIFLQFSVYLNRSYSSFSFFSFFVVFSFFALFHFLFFIFIFMFFLSPLPFLSSSLSCCLSMHKSRQKEKSPECQPMAQMAVKYKESKLGPRPLREFPEILGKNASSSCGRELSNTLRKKKVLSASRWPKWQSSTKKANWAPGPCANFRKFLERMPVLPVEESCLIHLGGPLFLHQGDFATVRSYAGPS